MKGDLSITTIVVAAIALLVLVVLVAVFTGGIGNFRVGVQDCVAKGGSCVLNDEIGESCPTDRFARITPTDCTSKEQICCVPLDAPKVEE